MTENKPPVQQNPNPSDKKKKKSAAGLIILIICIVLTALFTLLTVLPHPSLSDSDDMLSQDTTSSNQGIFASMLFGSQKEKKVVPTGDYIARIFITGVIEEENKSYSQKWLLETIKELEKDERNKGIMLILDSPGGAVYESDEVYLALSHYQSTRKPVWSYMTHLAASGAYYISCGSEYVCANRNTLTGSIGVIAGQSVDATELMNNVGIKSKTFTAGRNKNMLNFNCPLTEEQEAIMQSIADECYDQFTTIVAINRGLDKDYVEKLADGRIYTAKQALDLKLIDKICSYDEAINAMKSKYQFIGVEVFDYKYSPKATWMDILRGAISDIKPLTQSKEENLIELVSPSMKYPAYIYNQSLHSTK